MNDSRVLAQIVLYENSIFSAITASKQMLNVCSERCRRAIRNSGNFNNQVSVCTSNCKINSYMKLIAALRNLQGTGVSQEVLNKKIEYFTLQLAKEKQKYAHFRANLKKRQTTVPVDQSMKPSPERPESDKYN